MNAEPFVELIEVCTLRHIEGFSARRVAWLEKKITREGVWTVPVVLDRSHHLVMDGQHRMEVARRLGLAVIPALLYRYDQVEVWSLRPEKYTVSGPEVMRRALTGDTYPYKTAKHRFPCGKLPEISIPLYQLLYPNRGRALRIA